MKKNKELRTFLLRYAKQKGILVKEYVGHWPIDTTQYFCHIQDGKDPLSTSTAVSRESADNALCMAFLSWNNPDLDFL